MKARRAVQALSAYSPPLEGRRSMTRLDFNENTRGFTDSLELAPSLLTAYPEYQPLLEKLEKHLDLPRDWILPVNGSDEGLFVVAFTYIEPNEDTAVVSSPTFPLIPHSLELCQARLVRVPVHDDLSFNLAGIEEALQSHRPKLVMMASPDNPTGGFIPVVRLGKWLKSFPETLFCWDEAYGEYADDTALPLLREHPNLLISRTFSKAWGLAGLRFGLVLGHPQHVEWMRRVRSPYSVNSLAVSAILECLPRAETVLREARRTMERKARVLQRIGELGYRVTPGAANFFLIWLGPEARPLCDFMRAHGILVRDRSALPRMQGSVRVSVGTDEEMDRFLDRFTEFTARRAVIFDLDDTLVDTSVSYDKCILDLVEEVTGHRPSPAELQELRAEGGWNDDWDATTELLRRKGHSLERDEVEARGRAHYLSFAADTEELLCPLETLDRIASRHPVYIATGRPRDEYEPVWGARFNPRFREVVCRGNHAPKPAPDCLIDLLRRHELVGGLYVGNSVDDMQAARAAGLTAVGVTTNQSEEVLRRAGAEWILGSVGELEQLLMMEETP